MEKNGQFCLHFKDKTVGFKEINLWAIYLDSLSPGQWFSNFSEHKNHPQKAQLKYRFLPSFRFPESISEGRAPNFK